MTNLKKEVQFVKGVGPTKAALLHKLGIDTLEDLITYFPRELEDRTKPKQIAELLNGEEALIKAMIVSNLVNNRISKGRTMQKIIVRDQSQTCQITWFNQPYLKGKFILGETYYFFGRVNVKYGKIDMISPVYDTEQIQKNTCKIIPIYPLTYGLSQNNIRQIMENGLKEVGELAETLPDDMLKQNHLMDIDTAIHQIHFPDSFENFNKAKRRWVFEELFSMQLALLMLKNKYEKNETGIAFSKEITMEEMFQNLPFSLTRAQLRVLKEIEQDMEKDKPMNRLLQGDVGSRKNNC